jgi:electron transfer flavoprotein alpha subunit
MTDILVYNELLGTEATDLGLECLTLGRELADKKNMKLGCVALGSNIGHIAEKLSSYGPDSIYLADDSRLKDYLATPYKKVMSSLIAQLSPKIVLFPSSTQGNDIASILASELKTACVLDCKHLDFDSSLPVMKRLEFDNKVLTNFQAADGLPVIATLRDGITDVRENKRNAEVARLNVVLDENDLLSKIISRQIAKKTVDLKAAKIIVTAGAGIGSAQNFKLINEFATALNAEIGATRPVVDAGWASADRQIGQTGTTVKPDLYIACGVSGAVQHRVGMMDSKIIIAINVDPSAPIFKIAHYNIVGDVNDVLPKLIKLLKK